MIMGLQVTYSSTCPCSASLARNLIQQKFQKDFSTSFANKEQTQKQTQEQTFDWLGKEQSISATPHAQKSLAFIKLKVKEEKQSLADLINEVENVWEPPFKQR